ncbi:putative T7SS-secreted protein [Amycolatopsis orientalis]|uniref:putative T7SS-secreted protein n=1 Tax=Amycolatopsis orientalis TaxID=31958 RepID=UPI0003F623CE|nr:hypothetical protein [Amycolatopsis orientalis]
MADDFSALGFDPARGNVATVRELARQMTDTGKYANEAFEVLKNVKDKRDLWTGTAAQAFTSRLGPLPEYLEKSHKSLDKAGKALSTWSDRLDAHQRKARELEAEAKKAKGTAEQADSAARSARQSAMGKPDDANLHNAAVDKINAANAAWDRLADLRKQAENLKDTWEDDADNCADELKDAAGEAPTESFWDSLGSMFDDVGKWLKDHLGDIGDIAGIVAAVAGALAFIPILTPIMGPIALGAGAVALLAHGADMVVNDKWDDPNAWVSLGGDVIGMIPGVGAVAKGVDAASTALSGVDKLVDVSRATGMMNTAADAMVAGGKAFSDDIAKVVGGMQDPAKAFSWMADKAMGVGLTASPELVAMSNNVAKVIQGGTGVALQIPSALGLVDTTEATTNAKNTTGAIGAILGGISLK